MMNIHDAFLDKVLKLVYTDEKAEVINRRVFQTLLQLQILLLQAKLLGPRFSGEAEVLDGPFKGMLIHFPLREHGVLLPKIIGCYEQELHPYILTAANKAYAQIVNIGCADGYYAIGMARLMPHSTIYAYDLDTVAQERCQSNAEANGVSKRINVLGEFSGENFSDFLPQQTLIICDIEGAEEELLDPLKYPSLLHLDIIVEMHDVFRPGLSQRLMQKFASTHDISFIENKPKQVTLPDSLKSLTEFEQLLLTCELRTGPTPWAVMTVK
jgi:hypothetical protein